MSESQPPSNDPVPSQPASPTATGGPPPKKNSGLLLLISVVALAVAAYLIFTKSGVTEEKYEGPSEFWVYDLDNDRLTVMGPEDYPPIALPGGGTGYRATVVSCEDCGDAAKREVVLLTKYSDEARAAYVKGVHEEDLSVISAPEATLIATVEMAKRGEWVPSAANQEALIQESLAQCTGTPEYCLP